MSSNEASATKSFEAALQELEQLTAALEDPATGLEESIALYEKGTVLAKECKHRLEQAELRVERLRKTLEENDRPDVPPRESTDDQPDDPSPNSNNTLFPDPG